MKTNWWASCGAVTLFTLIAVFPSVGFSARPTTQVAAANPAAGTAVSIGEGQRLALKDGGYLTVKRGQLQQVSRSGAAKSFPRGSKITQDSRGQVGIWGTGGTTIVGTRSFDDPLFRTKPQGFDDPLLKPTTGTAGLKGAYIDPAIPRTTGTKGAYVDPALPKAPPK